MMIDLKTQEMAQCDSCEKYCFLIDDNDYDLELPSVWCLPDGWIFYPDGDVAFCSECQHYFDVYKLDSCGESGFVAWKQTTYFEPTTPSELISIVKYHFGLGQYLIKAHNLSSKQLEFSFFEEIK